jgi:ankyrin repeat protein
LDELPETLDGTYEQTLRGIDKQKWDYAYRLFQCLVVSRRPLRVEELAELFAIQPNAETIPTFDAYLRPENPEEFVLSACSTLVAVVNVDGEKIVQFSHFSVREYLISNRIAISEHVSRFHILPRPAHTLLTRVCLAILLQLDIRVDRDNIQNFPLALYAAQYWVDHAKFENVSLDIQYGMKCLFDKNKPYFEAWLRLYNIDDSSSLYMTTIHHPQFYAVPLYYAALCGFRDIAQHLVDAHPQGINARGGKRVTPLHAALEKGHLGVAMLLMERGADVESPDSWGQTPLHIASYYGFVEVASTLIDHGADLNAEEFCRETPLYLASERGHVEIVRLLLDHGADLNHPDMRGRTPLRLALQMGHDEVVRLMFDHGADANHPDNNGRSLLHHASVRGHNNTVKLLLDHGAVVNSPDKDGSTPLHLATLLGHNGIVQLLLDHGAVANHPDNPE